MSDLDSPKLINCNDLMIKLTSWNCREAAKLDFYRSVIDLKYTHQPTMLLILETKLASQAALDQATFFSFHRSFVVVSDGFASGLWLLWDDLLLTVDVVAHSC
ncbi:hypothetical protein SLA2020_237370 [Shorea laevis]